MEGIGQEHVESYALSVVQLPLGGSCITHLWADKEKIVLILLLGSGLDKYWRNIAKQEQLQNLLINQFMETIDDFISTPWIYKVEKGKNMTHIPSGNYMYQFT